MSKRLLLLPVAAIVGASAVVLSGSAHSVLGATTSYYSVAASSVGQLFAFAPPSVESLSAPSGSTSGGETVVIAGENLSSVTAVSFGDQSAQIVDAGQDAVSIVVPHTIDYQAATVAVTVLAGDEDVASDLSYTYSVTTAVDRQLQYAFAHWNNYNLASYGDFNAWGGDCINFVSQTLVARGWAPTADWFNHAQQEWAPAFVHVPSFDEWLSSHPEYGAQRLGLADIDRVVVGDVVLFDWDGDGSLDHAQVVSDVSVVDGATVISMVGHNLDSNYRTIDEALALQGTDRAEIVFWSIPA